MSPASPQEQPFSIDAGTYDVLARYSAPVKRAERKILGREKQIQSIMAAFSRPELCNVILLAPAGSGKALSDDELIAVNDERTYVRMGDIAVGDEVFDEAGNPTQVLGVYPQGLKRAYRVTFANGSSIVCNDEHLWCVRNRWAHRKDKAYEVMSLADMMAKGIEQQKVKPSGRVYREHEWFVPRACAVDRKDAALPVPPYAVGAFIADGCLVSQHGDSLVMSSNDSFVVDKVAHLLGAVARRNDANYNWTFKSVETGRLLHMNGVFADVMFDKTVRARKSIARRIPQAYLTGSVQQRLELLQGLLDTDGCVTGNGRANVRYSTSSAALARDVQTLAASLGMATSLVHTDRRDGKHVNREYEVHFSVGDEAKFDLFTLPRHLARLTERVSGRESTKRYDDMAIVDVHDMGVEIPMTCIYVEAESHLFQAGLDHIVTHNTALVQATMLVDSERMYLDVDVSKMIAEHGADTLGAQLKVLFDQTRRCVEETGREIVLFIDEFHKIINVSESAVEDLKPLLADSGTRGIRVLAATTLEEFNKYISGNQPLVERLQRINVPEPDEDLTVAILKGMAERYGVSQEFYNDHIFHRIYEYTNRYIPANSQPRKSILVLDAMVGWHRFSHRRMDERLLADVIMESEDVNVAFRVDASKVKAALDSKVLDQGYASMQIARRLQLCVADLNDKTKPMSTFLFTGSTGVGKALTMDTLVPMIDSAGVAHRKPAGEIEVGDILFSRTGEPTRVLGVFPQGQREVFRVTFEDGRTLDVSDNHLWAVYPAKHPRDCEPCIYSTKALLERGLETGHDRVGMKYFVPAAHAVQWPAAELPVPPYAMGALIGDGCLSAEDALVMSSDDEPVVARVAIELDAFAKRTGDYAWTFYTEPPVDGMRGRRVKQADVLGALDGVYRTKSPERRIPEQYLLASVEQRWDLVRGLFDTDGTIGQAGGDRFNVSYSTMSKGLADDVRRLLNSLGVSATVSAHEREGKNTEYHVHVRVANAGKADFFYLPRKREVALRASGAAEQREESFDYVGIRSIEPLGRSSEMVCFYVDNDEHLFQAGEHIVTHNTEMTKQLAQVLFGDSRRLIRFDMTEYANADTLERFRDLLTTRVWEHPYSIILLDEIEKACAEVTRLLLQVLDDGRLTNRNNREISFTNAYIVLTTNAGSEIYQTVAQYATGDGDEELKALAGEMKQMESEMDAHGAGDPNAKRSEDEQKADEEWVERYDKLIRRSISQTQGANRFPPELLGRIDMIVPFKPLSRSTMRRIVYMRLQRLQREILAKHNIQVGFDFDNVIAYLVDDKLDTDSNSGGARIVLSVLERDVTTAIARHINEQPPVTGRLYVSVDDPSLMAISSKTRLKSEAHIVVAEPYGARR